MGPLLVAPVAISPRLYVTFCDVNPSFQLFPLGTNCVGCMQRSELKPIQNGRSNTKASRRREDEFVENETAELGHPAASTFSS